MTTIPRTVLALTLAASMVPSALIAAEQLSRKRDEQLKRDERRTLRPADLVGSYVLTAGEKSGCAEPRERIVDHVVRFTETEVVVVDKDQKETYKASYRLEPGSVPCKITMTSNQPPTNGQPTRGLIEKTADTVRLIYALPGGETPADFKTKDNQLMFVMKAKAQ